MPVGKPDVSNVKVLMKNGRVHDVEMRTFGALNYLDEEGGRQHMYVTEFIIGDRIITSLVDYDLAQLSGNLSLFRMSEDTAFLEGLIYEIDKTGIETIDWPKE